MNKRSRKLATDFFRDSNGQIAVWQTPNPLLIGWFLCLITSYLLLDGGVKIGFMMLSSAFLFTWAYLEVTAGASSFRRVLGGVILITITIGFFR